MDKGRVLRIHAPHLLQYSHFSPLSNEADSEENYHVVSISLDSTGQSTLLSLTQDNNKTDAARQHSEANWRLMLGKMKEILEKANE